MKFNYKILIVLILGVLSLTFVSPIYATTFSFGATGDMGSGSNFQANMKLIGAQSVISTNPFNFFLAEGDLSYAAVSVSAWCQAVKDNINIGAGKPTGDTFGNNYPFELLAGNHDDSVASALIDDFTRCLPNKIPNVVLSPNYSGPTGTTNYGKEYYFDYPATNPIARFIFMSPNLTMTNGGSYSYTTGSARYNWVRDTIDSARTAGIPWVIANMHENAVDIGTKGNTVGANLWNLLLSKDASGRQRVDLILQGHDHTWQRTYGLGVGQAGCSTFTFAGYNSSCVINASNSITKNTATVLALNGTGGNGLYTINSGDVESSYFGAWMGSTSGSESKPAGGNGTYGLTRITISDSPLKLTAQYMRASGGNYTDSFSILGSNVTPGPTTPTPSRSPSPSPSRSPSHSPSPTPTRSPTPTPTRSPSPTPTRSPSPTASPVLKTGDINRDGSVNILDYTLLANAMGTSNAASDLNHDGIVNILDFTILSSNFGT